MRLPILLLLTGLALSGGSLDELRASLQKLQGTEPLKASLEHSFWRQITDDKKPVTTQAHLSAQLEANGQGLRMLWSHPTLQQAARELAAQEQEPERGTPTRTALKGVDPLEASEAMNHAEALLRDLSQAQVLEERAEAWQGRPARLLVLKISPRLPEPQRKYLKELKVEARLWLGPDGVPLAFTSSVVYKGSRFFITFEGRQAQELQFARVGSRLVVLRATSEDQQSGFGASSQTKKTTILTLH